MRRSLGFQLWQVQNGLEPDDWKPMPTIGPGIREVRVSGTEAAYRAFYLATLPELVHVYHVFEKKTQKTSQRDLETGRRCHREHMRRSSR